MTEALTVLIVLLFALSAYVYAGYPLVLLVLARLAPRRHRREEIAPSVTFIVTAHNEESAIREKLENTLALEYPRDRVEILVASDGSTDGTNAIVESCRDRGVVLVDVPDRKGKENAQRTAIERARGDVLVFSDVSTRLQPDGLRQIVSNFADPNVGAVSSEDRVLDREGQVQSEGVYVKYEMLLRRLESRVWTVIGLSGSFFAARREVCRDWAIDLPSDFNTVANTVRRGLRAVSDPKSIGTYLAVAGQEREFRRKVRTVIRGMSAFFRNTDLLNPLRYPLFAFQQISHKLGRWLVPVFLLAAFGLSIAGCFADPVFVWIAAVQAGGYALALLGILLEPLRSILPIRILAFFALVNASILVAWWKYLRGERMVTWAPSKR